MGIALDEPRENDRKVRVRGIHFIVAQCDEIHMRDSIIDFQESPPGEGFVVRPATSGFC